MPQERLIKAPYTKVEFAGKLRSANFKEFVENYGESIRQEFKDRRELEDDLTIKEITERAQTYEKLGTLFVKEVLGDDYYKYIFRGNLKDRNDVHRKIQEKKIEKITKPVIYTYSSKREEEYQIAMDRLKIEFDKFPSLKNPLCDDIEALKSILNQEQLEIAKAMFVPTMPDEKADELIERIETKREILIQAQMANNSNSAIIDP